MDSLVNEVWDCPECQASKPKRRGTATDRQRAAEQQKAAAAAVAAETEVGRRVKAGERKRKEAEAAAPQVVSASEAL